MKINIKKVVINVYQEQQCGECDITHGDIGMNCPDGIVTEDMIRSITEYLEAVTKGES